MDGSSDRATAFLFWLLLPAALLLLAILYVYLGKIVVTGSMPSGKLNWFGSVALASYVFFWLSLRGSSNRFFRLFARWGWTLRYAGMAALTVGIVSGVGCLRATVDLSFCYNTHCGQHTQSGLSRHDRMPSTGGR